MSRGSSSEKLFRFPKERVSKGDSFRCRKCRIYLFSFDNLTCFHTKLEPVEQCSAWYLNCDDDDIDDNDFMIWVKQAIHKSQWTEGKLYCPKCTSRIGAFNITQGVKCSCFAFVIPAVWIQKCKVDQVMATEPKLDISFPKQPNRPGGKNGDAARDFGQSSQTGLQISQSQSQSNQTELQTSETGRKTQQIKSQTCETGSQDLISKSKTCLSCSLTKLSRPQLDYLAGPSKEICGSSASPTDSSPNRMGFQIEFNSQFTDSDTQAREDTFPALLLDSKPESEIMDNSQSCDYEDFGERCNLGYKCQKQTSSLHTANIYKRHKKNVTRNSNENERVINVKDMLKARNNDEIYSDHQEETDHIPEHLICSVCLDFLYEPLFCPCKHVFCDSCLRLLNSKCKNTPKCPLCRKYLHYVYPAVEIREEIRKAFPNLYRNRHRIERRAVHRRLPLPNSRLKPRRKRTNNTQDIPMPYSVVVFLLCVLSVSVLCLVILFIFCPPTSNRCITVIGYD